MKPRSCVICGEGSHLFSFPKTNSERQKWADALKIEEASINLNLDKVCRNHFSTDQFRYKSRKRLKIDAIPSLNVAETNEQIDENECESDSNKNDRYRKDMCLLCGFVSALRFYRFPKRLFLRKQWAQFCGIETVDVKHYHRLCDKHFEFEYDRDKVPTLYPKELTECNGAVDNCTVLEMNRESNFESGNGIQCDARECEIANQQDCNEAVENCTLVEMNHGNIIPQCDVRECETVTQQGSAPLIYFKRFGDITEKDVLTPRRAILALRMGKAEVTKCRKKLTLVQTENYRLRLRISSLEEQLADLQKLNLLSKDAVQNILVN